MLFLSYAIGLWFTLRTHAAVIWTTEVEEKKPVPLAPTEISPQDTRWNSTSNGPTPAATGVEHMSRSLVRDSQLYKRILGQSLRQAGLPQLGPDGNWEQSSAIPTQPQSSIPHVVPPKQPGIGEIAGSPQSMKIVPGLSEEDNQHLVRQVAEMAATAATVATRDATRLTRRPSTAGAPTSQRQASKPPTIRTGTLVDSIDHAMPLTAEATPHEVSGGHDAPNWSKSKSAIILLVATIMYAVLAEVLVNTVDVVLSSIDIDEKFLGITLFALVPNTTEFLNAISFAMNGNIALSMEIGSAYALQVCLLQIPALVFYSAIWGRFVDPTDLIDHTFNLIFPQWDMVTVILCVFLLSYMYGEGKSNYFKGSVLILAYLVVLLGFYFSGFNNMTEMGVDRFDTLALGTNEKFMTVGRSSNGQAYRV